MLESIQGVMQRMKEIQQKIGEIQGFGKVNPITALNTNTTSDKTPTENAEGKTFSEVLAEATTSIGQLQKMQAEGKGIIPEELGRKIDQVVGSRHEAVESVRKMYRKSKIDMTQLNGIIKEASNKYGVEESLIKAVIKQESSFNPTDVSHAGAMGLMQLMPKTAELLGVSDAFDPYQNVMGGTQYLKDMMGRYDGDVVKALAAYNAGPARVDRAGGIPDIAETKEYVPLVLKYYREYKSLEDQSGE